MKKSTKSILSLSMASVLALSVGTTPMLAAQNDTAIQENSVQMISEKKDQQTFIVDGELVTFDFFEDDIERKYDVLENGEITSIVFNKVENAAYVNGEKVEEELVQLIQSDVNDGSSFTTFAIAGPWADGGTVKGSTKLGIMSASALAAFVAGVIGTPVAAGLLSAASVVIGMGVPTVWFTDKKKFRMVGATLEVKHTVSFYKDSARKKLIKSTTYTTRDTGGPK
ncbi:hypothetical protein [Cytobacillus kochii]|uniref:hypothetical protein n=1 Tax=Cytobacillus kochii TaxID=859143 RepID=UPI00204251EE|nr:hypothetical protein [Cytobacillus kochii]MCM3324787.1 hypothetical protein [Cytobacillus kochii]MCM3347180.1 hypothetical protein [Cytobacillus kochii]